MSEPQRMSLADPIHGIIQFRRDNETHRMLLDIINSMAFQRLRRIKQMGMAEFVFPGATHNRFVHSIGSTWLMIQAINHLKEFSELARLMESTYEDSGISIERLLLVGILVHDIGHTPLSHTLEDILTLKDQNLYHDSHWNELILSNDDELHQIWNRYAPGMDKVLMRFIGHSPGSERHFLTDLISSQLDMDRLDYLQRDSHYLGVQYGRIEVDRILTSLCVGTTPEGHKAVAVREEAIPAVEHYLFGRYQAYKMALHSLDKASEVLLKRTLERFAWARRHNIETGDKAELLFKLMDDGFQLSHTDYLRMDDYYLWDKIQSWGHDSEDPLLKALALRLLGHNLFKFVEITSYGDKLSHSDLIPVMDAMAHYYEQRGLSFEFGFDQLVVIPKPLYQPTPQKPPIWVRQFNGQLQDFSRASALPLRSLNQHEGIPNERRWLFFVWDGEARYYLKRLLAKHFASEDGFIQLP